MTMSFWTDSRRNILNHPPIRYSGGDFGDGDGGGGGGGDNSNDRLKGEIE